MEAKGVNQSELARQLGVTQGAIAKIANNNPNGSSLLYYVARALHTTPEYLTGEIDDPSPLPWQQDTLASDERELIDSYRALPPQDRAAVIRVIRSMNGIPDATPSTVHAPRRSFKGAPA